ncbi:Ribosomal protein S18 acetylase RimI [Geosmithia morbida]|uniref:Ribosomal protein S18 acetylase RimI n=1 Tax=Geosmithia morbida TaxID=1094350 RepID=A0A9P4YZ73_9HYPO|nr:Ribosomal protein S18 acetylase RimI [Geosmithia morbida]KAF4125783.1 Ribosomal protein S18 acetylase RimI [Geosmithia morbida]
MSTQTYHVRPGRLSDIPKLMPIFTTTIARDQLFTILFPLKNSHGDSGPEVDIDAMKTYMNRVFALRYWSPNFRLSVAFSVDDVECATPLAFSWWKLPDSQLSLYERWLSPYGINPTASTMFSRFIEREIEPAIFTPPTTDSKSRSMSTSTPSSQDENDEDEVKVGNGNGNENEHAREDAEEEKRYARRRQAFYLNTLAVLPSLQGTGLGSFLLRHGLRAVDDRGAAAWLIALAGVEPFYRRQGFVEVGRANVGEMSGWRGGAIMFRE